MRIRFKQIRDWEPMAQAAKYNVASLARACGVSVRHLERRFAISFGKSPRKWLHQLRMQRAMELMRDCTPVKEAAYVLGYKDATHFGHDFKKHFGISPGKVTNAEISVLS